MTKKNGLFNSIQAWFQKQFNLNKKPNTTSQLARAELKQFNENTLSTHQTEITPKIDKPIAKISPFILGLDNVKDLGLLTNNNFQRLIQWHWFGKSSSYPIEFPEREDFSTEVLVNSISWDFEPVHNIESVTFSTSVIHSLPPFIVGLDDIPNLEQIVGKDFLNLVNWEVNTQIGLPVELEDYSLLDDLLETFPE